MTCVALVCFRFFIALPMKDPTPLQCKYTCKTINTYESGPLQLYAVRIAM